MKQNSKLIFIQFLWLANCLVLTIVLSLMFFGKNILNDAVAIHIRDTYFLIDSFSVFFATFLLITFLIFFAKGFRNSFRDSLPNWILVITGLVLILSLTLLGNKISAMTIDGAISTVAAPKESDLIPIMVNLSIVLQFIFLSALIFVVYSWGKERQKNKD